MIPSPYIDYVKDNWKRAKREMAFSKKLRSAEQAYESIVESPKSVTISLNRKHAEITLVNMTDQDMLAVGKFLIEQYEKREI